LSVTDLYDALDAACISKQEAQAMSLEELKKCFVIGETAP
jgi:hypothetical protein